MADRFRNSRRLTWFALFAATGLQAWSLAVMGADAVPVLTAGIPSMLALSWGWSHTANKAETTMPVLPTKDAE